LKGKGGQGAETSRKKKTKSKKPYEKGERKKGGAANVELGLRPTKAEFSKAKWRIKTKLGVNSGRKSGNRNSFEYGGGGKNGRTPVSA